MADSQMMFPKKTSIYHGFYIAMLNNLMVVWWFIDDDILFIPESVWAQGSSNSGGL